MSKIIIGLVGPLASGKGTVKKYLVEKYKAEDCRFSTILRDILNRANIEISRTNLQKVSTILRQNFGEDTLAKAIANDAKNFTADVIVVDGVRREADIKFLRELPNFILVSVEADSKIRYERMVRRNENKGDDLKTYEDFMKDHLAETEMEIPAVMNSANFKLNNNGSPEDLCKQIDQLFSNKL